MAPAPWRLVRCDCAMVYLENAPADAELEEEMAWEKSIVDERARRREGRGLHYAVSDVAKQLRKANRGTGVRAKERRLIERHVVAGRVLDLGCGDGRTVRDLGEAFTPFGVEISLALAAQAELSMAPRGGRVERAPGFEGLDRFDDGFFDGAILRAYLEHETRPLPVLTRLLAKLRPGGRVIVKVPNHASLNRRIRGRHWCGYRFPDHVNYFTPTTLRRLVEKAGFEVASCPLRMRQPTSDNQWLVAQRPAS